MSTSPANHFRITLATLAITAWTSAVHAQTSEIDAAEAWLLSQQQLDGTFGTSADTPDTFRQTALATEILERLDPAGFDESDSIDWLAAVGGTKTVEETSRRGCLAALTGRPTDFLLDAISSSRQAVSMNPADLNYPEGGWGLYPGDGTNNLDTTLALKFLAEAGYGPGLVLNSRTLPVSTFETFSFTVPANATMVQAIVTEAAGTFEFRFTQGSPPTGAEGAYTVSAAPTNLTGAPIGPGVTNYVRIDAVTGGTYSFKVIYSVPTLDDGTVTDAVTYLLESQNPDGGWGLAKDDDSELFMTARVLLVLQELNDGLNVDTEIINGLNWIAAQQNGDYGFGSPTSNVIDSALAYQALSWAGVSQTVTANTLGFLVAAQAVNGSWNDEVLDTAIALAALRLSLREIDGDSDGTPDIYDNCPGLSNPSQADNDGDGIGDLCDPDDDNDGLSDTFETTVTGTDPFDADTGGTGVPDGERDPDFDGLTNAEEEDLGSDPNAANKALLAGLNLFTYPVNPPGGFSAFDLLADLGGETVVECLQKYNPDTGVYEEARYTGATPTGTDFDIAGGDGFLVYLLTPTVVNFAGTPVTTQPDLHNGPNLRTFNDAAPDDTAFDVFAQLSGYGTVVTLQRYLPQEGRFQSISTYRGLMLGTGFPIVPGETYLVQMDAVAPYLLVTSHTPNETVFTSPVTISGEIGPDVTSVIVNGVSSTVGSGTFSAAGIPLTMGANSIAVLAETGTGEYNAIDFNLNLDNAPDYTLVADGSVTTDTDSYPITATGVAGIWITYIPGLPSGLNFTAYNFTLSGGGTILGYTFDISANPGMTPGRYNFTMRQQLTDGPAPGSGGTVLHTEDIPFVIDVVAP